MARGRLDSQPLYEPRESIGLTAQWLTQLRQEIGPEPVIGIDYHHRLSVAEAASFCQRMRLKRLTFWKNRSGMKHRRLMNRSVR